MYNVVASETFVDIIKQCGSFCIADVDMDTGNAKLIKRRQLLDIVQICTEIRCYQDDMLKRYDIYYRENEDNRLARVLMEAG